VTDEPDKLVDETSFGLPEERVTYGAAVPDQPIGAHDEQVADVSDEQVEETVPEVDRQTGGESLPEREAEVPVEEPAELLAEVEPVEAEVGEEEPAAEEIEVSTEEAEAGAEEPVPSGEAVVVAEPEPEEEIHMDWYILKVQSNRERSISEALQRKIAIEGLSKYFGQVIVPTEKVTEFKGGKKKVVERKLYPGYIVVQMHINDDTWFAVRETSGVGDFTGAGGKPTPMLPHEVARIIQTEVEETSEAPKLDIRFAEGDKVKVKEGNFENFEGEVSSIDEASGRVTVMINIFGRSTPVELEYWQIEAV
jgi:transcriptional antiterminator NusG